jgi:putative DNA primase/helicase
MNVVQQFESTAYLSPKHKSHIESRGLLNDWSFANCRTVSADEASVYLGYPRSLAASYSWVQPHNFSSGRTSLGNQKAVKRHPNTARPLGEYDAFLPQHPTDKNYWEPENLKSTATALTTIPIS